MLKFILRRLLLLIIILPLLHAAGYNYALLFYTQTRPNRPPHDHLPYPEYLRHALQTGEWGEIGRIPIWEFVAQPFLNSLVLVVIALFITLLGGVLIGVFSVSRHTKRISPAGLLLTTAGASIPGFLLGGVVITVIIYQILYNSWSRSPIPLSGFGLDIQHLALPLLVLAVRPTLHFAKMTASLLEHELHQEYVRVARSKGLTWLHVYWKHAFRNIIAPLTTVMGQATRFIVAGLLIVEMMFLWPGLGRFFVYAVAANENIRGQHQFYGNPYLLAALAVLIGLMLLTADLIAGAAAYQADPRIRDV